MDLWCLPYAGASASFYRKWAHSLGGDIHVRPLELPGRGARFGEPVHRSIDPLLDYAYEQIRGATDFALFGHSLGAEIAFRLALRLEAEANVQPRALIVSGLLPPSEPRSHRIDHRLPDDELVQELERLGGMAPEVMNHPELLQYMLPIIRADLEAVNGAAQVGLQADITKVRCDMTVLYGRKDPLTVGNLERWKEYAQGAFALREFEGGHFFIHDEQAAVAQAILSTLSTSDNAI